MASRAGEIGIFWRLGKDDRPTHEHDEHSALCATLEACCALFRIIIIM